MQIPLFECQITCRFPSPAQDHVDSMQNLFVIPKAPTFSSLDNPIFWYPYRKMLINAWLFFERYCYSFINQAVNTVINIVI